MMIRSVSPKELKVWHVVQVHDWCEAGGNINTQRKLNWRILALFTVKTLWGNFSFDFAFSPSVGSSGGILCVWDPRVFVKDNVSISDSFVAIRGTWIPSSTKLLLISVYAPQDVSARRSLWEYIGHLIEQWDSEYVVLGDFNEVRYDHERFGSIFNELGANAFNHFISSANLVDLPLEGYSFTWAHKSASKMSKLDRFLVSEGLLSIFPSLSAICLDRHLSDHKPILMRELVVDYGPSPFRMFSSWFSKQGFDKIVEDTWNNSNFKETNSIVLLKKKLQASKFWISFDQGNATDDLVKDRSALLKDLHDINSRLSFDMAQKAKIRWSIEGDENSKNFHGILNKKRAQLAIRGVFVDGNWIDDPTHDRYWYVVHDDVVKACQRTFHLGKTLFRLANFIGCSTYSMLSTILGLRLEEKKVGNGEHTCFWEDVWLDDCPLKSSFPRFYALENVKQVSVASKIADSSLSSSFRRVPRGGIEEEQLLLLVDKISLVLLSNSLDRWSWTLTSSGEFSVKSARNHIDDVLLPSHGSATRWVNKVPIKINILAWKVCKDILPTRFNLSLRGVDINSILCPVCHMAGESSSHLFFSCNVVRLLFQKITRWWDLDVVDLFSYEDWISWLSSLRLSKGAKSILEGVIYVSWWAIWKYRNQVIFGSSPPRLHLIFDEIVLMSFTYRNKRNLSVRLNASLSCVKLSIET
ncbi:RNA-directed DNA polymerase, eukaryota [Tanacetum coccineum]